MIVEALRGRPRTVGELGAVERAGVATYCCAVSWVEIFAGLRPGEEVVPDALIAAAATTAGLRLWTLNRRHYPMDDVRFYEPSRE